MRERSPPPRRRRSRARGSAAASSSGRRSSTGKRKVVKVRKCKPRKKAKPPVTQYPPAPPVAVAPPVPAPPAPPRLKVIQSPIAVYQGTFGPRQAERLAWRAGFGPRPGQVAQLAALDLEAAVMSFTRPTGQAPLDGPEPRNGASPINVATDEGAFAYWLDRMVRSRHQLVERLALVFHDWWATRRDGVSTNAEMLNQTNIFRAHGLGSFRDMTRAVTTDPAMLQFLNGFQNRRGAVNENYARELMELFTLGADRGAYTENDVRELARALTGWRADYNNGWTNWRWDEDGRWDFKTKTVFGKSGRFTWQDACELVLEPPAARVVLRPQALGLLRPDAAERRDRGGARAALRVERQADPPRAGGDPLLARTSTRARAWSSRRSCSPPACCAPPSRGIENNEWWYKSDRSGQRLYYPPDVSGWNDERWLDTNTTLGRWELVGVRARGPDDHGHRGDHLPAADRRAGARRRPARRGATRTSRPRPSRSCSRSPSPPRPPPATTAARPRLRAQRFNALRQLVAASPDYQTC